jgi:DHA1 family tetracycline resistance protein-like MFS transporter
MGLINGYHQRFKSLDRRLVTILLIVFVQMLGAAMILPILPLYAKREFKMTPQVITLLTSSFFAAQFLAGPYLGRLSDRIGRLPVLIVSQIGTAVSFTMLAFAPGAGLLFLARILDGITGGNIIVAQAYITDITPKERRTEALGYIFAVFGIGFIIGPALGGMLSAYLGPRVPYLIAAVAAGLTVLLTWRTLDETLRLENRPETPDMGGAGLSVTALLANSSLILILTVAFIGQFGVGMLQSTFALYGEAVLFAGMNEVMVNLGIGLTLTIVGLGQFITQAFILRPMVRRFGDARLVVFGLVIRSVGFFIFAMLSSILLASLSAILFSVGNGLMMPPLQSSATRTVSEKMRGAVLGIYQSGINLAIIFSTSIAGVVFAIYPTAPFWSGFILSIAALIPALLFSSRMNKPDAHVVQKPEI